ncbi:MAG: M20/M25/M40 family metallo-hydrolase [Pyrinomonadaceae bacterium]|nr:M20/M25/M40 family metallo-hydrolase [Pyrinomonadaceae bacterium]
MKKFKQISVLLIVLGMFLQAAPFIAAQTGNGNADINAKIRKEAMENSQIMKTLHYFTDVYGPRLTGSPKLKMAGEWAMKEMKSWGFDRTEMEPWDWGHPGWESDRAWGSIESPVRDSLVFEVLAWTPSTKGTVRAQATQINVPRIKLNEDPRCMRNPTQEEFTEFVSKSDVKGKIVLVGSPRSPGVDFDPPAKRLDAEALGRRNTPRPPADVQPCPKVTEKPLDFRELASQFDKFLLDSGAVVRIDDAGREHGQIRAFGNRSYDPSTVIPTVVLRNEDYGRIWRLLSNGSPVELAFNIQNSIYPEGKTSYNTIGEIAGSDKADEVIMLGGHLDSWHASTGATDNAIGCAVMMEAARILKAIGVKPRRTIRVALWSGEEQGLLGSQAYVEKHFGSFENPKPAYSKFGGYFNIDSGTGRARGMSVFGPPEAAGIVNQAILPFYDLNVIGASSTASRGLGGSDHTSFNQAGLPGIGVLQDPIEYFTHTWHTNLDSYERIVEDDVKASAAVIAAAVYELAMRDELLPRFSKDKMPKPPERRQ